MTSTVICFNCLHYKGSGKCKAFKTIPKRIWFGGDHKKVWKKQLVKIKFKDYLAVSDK